jgi:hypothetical protein
MDRRNSAGKGEASDEGFAKRGGADRNEAAAAESWFKDRLNFVRNELRKELRTKVVSAPVKRK